MVDGLVRLMASADDFTGPVNLGNPRETTIVDLARRIIELTGSRSGIVHKALPSDDPKQRQPDIALATAKLGWEPRANLDDGLRKAIDYFARQMDIRPKPAAVTP